MRAKQFSSDLAVEASGTLIVLFSRKNETPGYSLTRCNSRGEPIDRVEISDCPLEFSEGFLPDSLACRNDQIYLVDRGGMKAVVTDSGGSFLAGYFITADRKGSTEGSSIESFSVDDAGEMAFTLSCQSEPVVITFSESDPGGVACAPRVQGDGLTLGLIAFVGLFVSCYLIR